MIAQIGIHLCIAESRGKARAVARDLLQLPLCLLFTRLLNVFSAKLPTPGGICPSDLLMNMTVRLLLLLLAIVLTGLGAVLTLGTGFLFAGRIIGVGMGTVLAVLLVGRVMAVFHHFCLKRIETILFQTAETTDECK